MNRNEIEQAFKPANPEEWTGGPDDSLIQDSCNSENLSAIVLILREIACQLADMNERRREEKKEKEKKKEEERETHLRDCGCSACRWARRNNLYGK